MLRSSRINPLLSAYAYLFGNFDFNQTPMAPPDTKVVAHKKPSDHRIWEFHGQEGWYICPGMDHYRCVTIYFPKTRKTAVLDTVTFIPHSVKFPKVTLEDFLKQATEDIITILKSPKLLPSPILN